MVKEEKLQVGAMRSDPPFETVAQDLGKSLVFLCDHASNFVPEWIGNGSLGLSQADMERHIAYDIGARGLTLKLIEQMGGAGVLSKFSRLVIDPNRGEDDPTLVMRLYDGTIIPRNRNVDDGELERRLNAFHRPYHKAVSEMIDQMGAPVLISIHSFTPQLQGKAPRPWHIGVLSAGDRRIADLLLERLDREPDICTGDNVPYVGSLEGDCMSQHGLSRNLPHVLIEVRNDLISTEAGETEWAGRLVPILNDVIATYRKKESENG